MILTTERGFKAYQDYIAINLHFDPDSSYDYFRYNGKTSASQDKYQKRTDALFFELLAKHHDPKHFVAYNRAQHGYISIKNLVRLPKYKNTYNEVAKNIQSAHYWLSKQLVNYPNDKRKLFEVIGEQHPLLLRMHVSKKVTLLEMCILQQLYPYLKYFDKHIQEQVFWPKVSSKIRLFTPFVEIDANRIKPLFDAHFSQLAT